MSDQLTDQPPTRRRPPREKREMHVLPLLVKIVALGLVFALAAAVTPTLLGLDKWFLLVAVWTITGVLLATYATGRGVPAKYLVPGTLLLICFVVYPIVLTAQLSTTNYGDGTRGTKDEAVAQIIGSSVVQTPDAPRYNLSIGTSGSETEGPFVFLLVDPETDESFLGDAEGLQPLEDATVTDGFVTEASGYTLLTPVQVNDAQEALADFTVPTDNGAIRQLGIREAFEGRTRLEYDEAADTITDTDTGTVYSPVLRRRPGVLRRRGRRARRRPVVAGQRRLRQLQADLHRPADQQRLPPDPRLDPAVRHLVGRHHVLAGPGARLDAERPTVARTEDLPGDPDPPLRHPGLHLAAVVGELLQPRLRSDQQHPGARHPVVRRRDDGQGRGAADEPLDGLPLHVPGLHRRADLDPGGPQGGRCDRRGEWLRRLPAGSPSRCSWSRWRRCWCRRSPSTSTTTTRSTS